MLPPKLLLLLTGLACCRRFVVGQDVSYIATQNFLIDLPYRNGSYANQLTTAVMTSRLPEYSDCTDPVTGANACTGNPCGEPPHCRQIYSLHQVLLFCGIS